MSVDAIRLDPADHVATALRPLEAGREVVVGTPDGPVTIRLATAVPAFHKFALTDLAAGTRVRKYGAVIGAMREPVEAGAHVHVHNLESLKARPQGAAR